MVCVQTITRFANILLKHWVLWTINNWGWVTTWFAKKYWCLNLLFFMYKTLEYRKTHLIICIFILRPLYIWIFGGVIMYEMYLYNLLHILAISTVWTLACASTNKGVHTNGSASYKYTSESDWRASNIVISILCY